MVQTELRKTANGEGNKIIPTDNIVKQEQQIICYKGVC